MVSLQDHNEPVAWRDPTNSDPGQGCTYDKAVYEKWPHIYKQPLYTAPQPAKQPLTEDVAKAIAYVGPVYAPYGVMTRHPQEYRKELEQHRLDAIRRTEAAHGIGETK